MKNFYSLILICICFLMHSCEKEEFSVDMSKLYGSWEYLGEINEEESSRTVTFELGKMTASTLMKDGSCQIEEQEIRIYENRIIPVTSLLGIAFSYDVKRLDAQYLKMDYIQSGGDALKTVETKVKTLTYKRIEQQ